MKISICSLKVKYIFYCHTTGGPPPPTATATRGWDEVEVGGGAPIGFGLDGVLVREVAEEKFLPLRC